MNAGIEIQGDEVVSIGIRAWKENYVQTVTMKQSKAGSASLESQSNNGTMKEFKLGESEKIVGVHGYLDQNRDLRGFGFIVAKT